METIAVWFSCGAASAVGAMLTKQQYGDTCLVRVLNNPVIEEDADNVRFLRDVEKWLELPIETVKNHKYPTCSAVDVWDRRNYMSGNAGAPCTLELKKMARQQFEMDNDIDWHVLGFTAEEEKRFCNFQERERRNTLPVLIEAGMSKADCYRYLQEAGIKPPAIYERGYPNANCIGCVKATSPTYWNHVRKEDPEVFQARLEQSRRIGAKLVRCHPKYLSFCSKHCDGLWYDDRIGNCLHDKPDKNGKRKLLAPRIYLDELPADAKGRPMKNLDFECGIFCHTHGD
jgi:hypothetical protein